MGWQFWRARGGLLASPIFVPVVLLTSLALALLMVAAIWSRDAENAVAEQHDAATLRRALGAELNDLLWQAARLAEDEAEIASTAAAEFELAFRARNVPFEQVLRVDLTSGAAKPDPAWPDSGSIAGFTPDLAALLVRYRGGDLGKLRGSIADEGAPPVQPDKAGGSGAGRALLFARGKLVHVVAIVPDMRATPASQTALVAIAPLDGSFLARLVRRAGIGPIGIVADPGEAYGSTRLALADAEGRRIADIAFTPQHPGDARLLDFAAFLVFFAAIFASLVVLHARQVARVLSESEARAQQLAGQDILSGLPNRALFDQYLEAEIGRTSRTGSAFALFYLDLDRFKEINDTFGHEAGDRMIKAAAQRVSGVLRGGDRLARLGGDEFAILQTEVRSPRDCEKLAKRILHEVAKPFDLGEQNGFVGVSIGIALFPHDAKECQELARRADLALYRAKNEGRNRFCFFEQRMGEELRMRKTVEDELRTAIERDELIAHYQPIVSADGERLVGVEALVRWQHPVHGLISPERFVGLAEDSGLILPLGEWVLRKACTDGARWPQIYIAVNVSPIQFRHNGFAGAVERILEETGMDPSRLELELTEGVVVKDADQAENAIIELRAKGVRLALDDFGIGYSSLIYLRRFAFDKIKIDKSFLQSMEMTGESAIILHSIVHLGRALGLTVTAEGIETSDQHRFLQSLGCHELQGFLFSPPLDAEAVSALVARGSSEPQPPPTDGAPEVVAA